MVDEDAFRATWETLERLPCPFAKALLGGFAACRRERRIHLAERVGVECGAAASRRACARYLDALRDAAGPGLPASPAGAALPHARQLQLQVGGLRGLRRWLDPAADGTAPVGDAGDLVAAAAERGAPAALPWEQLVAEVAACVPRRRR